MSKAKSNGGTGRGTDKKGWNRWQASAKKAKNSPKPYTSKGDKQVDGVKDNSHLTTKTNSTSRKGRVLK